MSKVIQHPALGTITDIYQASEWQTEPLQIGAFVFKSGIRFFTKGCEPSKKQLDDAVRVKNASGEFKAEMERHMLENYSAYIRPNYITTVGDARYSQNLTMDDLPDIKEPSQIWRVIDGCNDIVIDDKDGVGFSFKPKFDPGHVFAVNYRKWEVEEVLIDG